MSAKFTPLQEKFSFYERVFLYDTFKYFYLVGSDELRTAHKIIKINRLVENPGSLADIVEVDSTVYDLDDLESWLATIDSSNSETGGVFLAGSGYGIIGFIKFLGCYYLTMITEVKKVGQIYSNWIYTIKSTEIFPMTKREETGDTLVDKLYHKVNRKITESKNMRNDEQRYLGLFQFLDCTKDFFFSYTYDLTHSFQHNYVKSIKFENEKLEQESDMKRLRRWMGMNSFQTMYMWNYYHIYELFKILDKKSLNYSWIMPIIYGGYEQKRFDCLTGYLDLVVLARRSRHYAGTRYLKRGISVHGDVANDVEIELILQWEQGGRRNASSLVQFRGSIPTYWSQEVNALDPMPPINIFRHDPNYVASKTHFANVIRRYGSPIIILDLVKHKEKKKREMLIGSNFRDCLEELNFPIPLKDRIRYIGLDYTSMSKQDKQDKAALKSSNQATNKSGVKQAIQEFSKLGNSSESSVALKRRSSVRNIIDSNGNNGNDNSDNSNQNNNQNQDKNPSPKLTHQVSQANEEKTEAQNRARLYTCLDEISDYALYETGFFCSTIDHLDSIDIIEPKHVSMARQHFYLSQNGVMRTNCVDCLDRTNGGQFALAKKFLIRGLQALGVNLADKRVFASDTTFTNESMVNGITAVLTDVWASIGNNIAVQYGGSLAHNKLDVVSEETKESKSKSKKATKNEAKIVTSVLRYYNNTFTDNIKQDSINVFLGLYKPFEYVPIGLPNLWDLSSDTHMHNRELTPVDMHIEDYVNYVDMLSEVHRFFQVAKECDFELSEFQNRLQNYTNYIAQHVINRMSTSAMISKAVVKKSENIDAKISGVKSSNTDNNDGYVSTKFVRRKRDIILAQLPQFFRAKILNATSDKTASASDASNSHDGKRVEGDGNSDEDEDKSYAEIESFLQSFNAYTAESSTILVEFDDFLDNPTNSSTKLDLTKYTWHIAARAATRNRTGFRRPRTGAQSNSNKIQRLLLRNEIRRHVKELLFKTFSMADAKWLDRSAQEYNSKRIEIINQKSFISTSSYSYKPIDRDTRRALRHAFQQRGKYASNFDRYIDNDIDGNILTYDNYYRNHYPFDLTLFDKVFAENILLPIPLFMDRFNDATDVEDQIGNNFLRIVSQRFALPRLKTAEGGLAVGNYLEGMHNEDDLSFRNLHIDSVLDMSDATTLQLHDPVFNKDVMSLSMTEAESFRLASEVALNRLSEGPRESSDRSSVGSTSSIDTRYLRFPRATLQWDTSLSFGLAPDSLGDVELKIVSFMNNRLIERSGSFDSEVDERLSLRSSDGFVSQGDRDFIRKIDGTSKTLLHKVAHGHQPGTFKSEISLKNDEVFPDRTYQFGGMTYEEVQRRKYRKATGKSLMNSSNSSSKKFSSFLVDKVKDFFGINDSSMMDSHQNTALSRNDSSVSVDPSRRSTALLLEEIYVANEITPTDAENEKGSVYQMYEDIYNDSCILLADSEFESSLNQAVNHLSDKSANDRSRLKQAMKEIREVDDAARRDYTFFLGEQDINEDDVVGMEDLAMCAHLTTTMLCDEYDGLSHLDSGGLVTMNLHNALNHAEYELIRSCAADDCVISIDSSFKSVNDSGELKRISKASIDVVIDSDDDDEILAKEIETKYQSMAAHKDYSSFADELGDVFPMGLRSRTANKQLALFPLSNINHIRSKDSGYLHAPIRNKSNRHKKSESNLSSSSADYQEKRNFLGLLEPVYDMDIQYTQYFLNSFSVPHSVTENISALGKVLKLSCDSEDVEKWVSVQAFNIALRYLFEQVAFISDLSFYRLTRRLSNMSNEANILNYCSFFHNDVVASDLQNIAHLVTDSGENSSQFSDLHKLFVTLKDKFESYQQQYAAVIAQLEESKNVVSVCSDIPPSSSDMTSLATAKGSDKSNQVDKIQKRDGNISGYISFPYGPFRSEDDYLSKSLLSRCSSNVEYYDFKLTSQSGMYERVDNPFFIMNEASVFFFTKLKALKNMT